MKNSEGFSLVELIVVISILAILITTATLGWDSMKRKQAIEDQIRTLFADMMSVRSEALYTKRDRSVVVTGNSFKVYSSSVIIGTPLSAKSFKYNFTFKPVGTSLDVTFDTSGLMTGSPGSVCVDPYNDLTEQIDAAVDSIIISQGRINLGKRDEGGQCDSNGIKQK